MLYIYIYIYIHIYIHIYIYNGYRHTKVGLLLHMGLELLQCALVVDLLLQFALVFLLKSSLL